MLMILSSWTSKKIIRSDFSSVSDAPIFPKINTSTSLNLRKLLIPTIPFQFNRLKNPHTNLSKVSHQSKW